VARACDRDRRQRGHPPTGTFEFELTFVPAEAKETPPVSTLVDHPSPRTGIEDDRPCRGETVPGLPGTLLFTTSTRSGPDVWIAQPGKEPGPLVRHAESASFSPDGTRIAYVTASSNRPPDLVVGDVDGHGGATIVHEALEPDWSPDGTRIVFTKPTFGSQIWIVDADGANAERLVAIAGTDRDGRLTATPSCSRRSRKAPTTT